MDTSTVVMMVGAVAALAVVYYKSPETANQGLNATGSLILEITPRMIAADGSRAAPPAGLGARHARPRGRRARAGDPGERRRSVSL